MIPLQRQNIKNMQHFLLSLCLAATLGAAEARIPSDMEEPIAILITQNDGDYPVGNRGPVVIPISGYVDSNTGVYLNFSQSCGMVYIEFNNLNDGSYFDTTVNGNGPVMIPAILSSGLWQVVFYLPGGTQYRGEFMI